MNYNLINRESFKVIGRRSITSYGGGTWAVVNSDGSARMMKELSGHSCDLGLCFGFDENGNNDYMCGVEWEKNDILELDSYIYPASTWLIFEVSGKISQQVLNSFWQEINNDFFVNNNYIKSDLPSIERYLMWDNDADICNLEIWIPVTQE